MSGYSFIVKATPRRMLDPTDSADYVGGESILERMVKFGWLKPAIIQNRLTRYDLRDLDLACDRFKRDTLPN